MIKNKKRFILISAASLLVIIIATIITLSVIAHGPISIKIDFLEQKATYAYGDTIKLRATVKNAGLSIARYTFSSTCTDPDIYIDGKDMTGGLLCGQAITNVTLAPGQETNADFEFTFKPFDQGDVKATFVSAHRDIMDDKVQIITGSHKVWAKWEGAQSNILDFEVK